MPTIRINFSTTRAKFMEFLKDLYIYVVPFLAILTVLVFVHELGHYLFARLNGVKVEVFSIGFGPEIFGWNDKSGTRWKISWLPLGGYVRMFSDANAASQPDMEKAKEMTEEEKKVSLLHKTVWQRIQVSAAGPLANYLFAILILGGLFAINGQRVPVEDAKIGMVMPGSAADKSGLKQNDLIAEIQGQKVETFAEMQEIILRSPEKALDMIVVRKETRKIMSVTPDKRETKDAHGNTVHVGVLGVTQGTDTVKRGPISAFWYATTFAWEVTVRTVVGISQMVMGTRSADSLSGPLGIAKMTAEIAQTTWVNIFWFMAFLSINLGLINLFPIPMLDGGHLLFYFIEAIRGKPVSEKAQEWGFRIGLMIVLFLFLFSTWNDVSRFEFLKNLFN